MAKVTKSIILPKETKSTKETTSKKVVKKTTPKTPKTDSKLPDSKAKKTDSTEKKTPKKSAAKQKIELLKPELPRSIKHILISQPEPTMEKSPYSELAKRFKLKFTYIPFLKVESVPLREFRKSKINLSDYTIIVFNSKNSIDYFFKICEELRHKMPSNARYICSSEAIAFYLQKYIQFRKRKVIYTNGTPIDMQNTLKKYQETEKILIPCSNKGIGFLPKFLEQNKFNFVEAEMYRMVPNEELASINFNFDMVTFFNPEGVRALLSFLPNFLDKKIAVGAFGENTIEELKKRNINVHAKAPVGEIKSMVMAIEKLLRDNPNLAEEL